MNQGKAPAYKNNISSVLHLWESSFLTWQESKWLTRTAAKMFDFHSGFQKDSVVRKDPGDSDSMSFSRYWGEPTNSFWRNSQEQRV